MKRSVHTTIILASCILLFTLHACVDHNLQAPFTVNCSGVEDISYSNDVVDVINANCAVPGCHDGSPGLPDWTELSNLQNGTHQKEIKRRITLDLADPDKMPRVGSITQEERELIYCWIEQGAKDN